MDQLIQRQSQVIFKLQTMLLTGFLLLIIITGFCQTTSRKLPDPKQDQIKSRASQKGLAYFEANFTKVARRLILKQSIDCQEPNTGNDDCVCAWEQRFDKGIVYQFNDCAGARIEATITFTDYDRTEIVRLVDQLFRTNNNVWNREKTEYKLKEGYEPKEDELTCDYKIKNKEGTIELLCICGWW